MSNLLLINNSPICALWAPKSVTPLLVKRRLSRRAPVAVRAFFFNPADEPILKEAVKEPVAFMGGVFAGLLRLDLNEEPLKDWVNRTVQASGINEEEVDVEGSKPEEETPQPIDIE